MSSLVERQKLENFNFISNSDKKMFCMPATRSRAVALYNYSSKLDLAFQRVFRVLEVSDEAIAENLKQQLTVLEPIQEYDQVFGMTKAESGFRCLRMFYKKRYQTISGGYKCVINGGDIDKILNDLGNDPYWLNYLVS